MSGLSCLAVAATFVIPLFMTGRWHPPAKTAAPAQLIAYYGFLFLYYYCNYFVIVFFNSALVSYVVMRMNGDHPSVGDGFRAALARWPLIAGWALIAATVGFLLKIIEDRSDKVGQIVAALLGGAWAMVTFLVIPVLVVEQKNPFSALKESTVLLKQTWGERIMMNFSFSTISFLLMIPAIGIIVLAVMAKEHRHSGRQHCSGGDVRHPAHAGAIGPGGDFPDGDLFLRAEQPGARGL